MTETTRIRWTAGTEASMTAYFGLVANCGPHLFQIFKPAFKGDQHTLRSELPGQRYSQRDGDPDTLKAEAERWLAGFVSSLGAVFPGGHPEGNAIEAYCATETEDGDDRHLLQYAVRLPDGTTTAYGDQSWVSAGLAARDNDGASTVVRDIWLSYGPWRTHETTAPRMPTAFRQFPPASGMDDRAAEDNGIIG